MTRVGNVDHVLMLLQQQLHKLQSTEKGSRNRRAKRTDNAEAQSSLRRLAAISATNEFSDEEFERALIRALLVDELGTEIADDHRFDRIAAEVFRQISSEPKTHSLLRNAVNEALRERP